MISIKFGAEDVHKISLSECELSESRYSESYTVQRDVKNF